MLSTVLLWLVARVECLAWPWFFARGAGSLDLWGLRTLSWIGRSDDLAGGDQRWGAVGACNPNLESAAFYAPPVFGAGYPGAGVFVTPLVFRWFLPLPCRRVLLPLPACAPVLKVAWALVPV